MIKAFHVALLKEAKCHCFDRQKGAKAKKFEIIINLDANRLPMSYLEINN